MTLLAHKAFLKALCLCWENWIRFAFQRHCCDNGGFAENKHQNTSDVKVFGNLQHLRLSCHEGASIIKRWRLQLWWNRMEGNFNGHATGGENKSEHQKRVWTSGDDSSPVGDSRKWLLFLSLTSWTCWRVTCKTLSVDVYSVRFHLCAWCCIACCLACSVLLPQ